MLIGKNINDENKYLKNTIKKINELLDSYGVSSEKQDKEMANNPANKLILPNETLSSLGSIAAIGEILKGNKE